MTMCTKGLPQLMHINTPQGMILSSEAKYITGLNQTLQQLITQLTLYKLQNPRERKD